MTNQGRTNQELIEEISVLKLRIHELEQSKAGLKRAEEALHENKHQWTDTFDAISDSVCLIAPDGRIIEHNKATERLLGKSASELDGHFCFEVVHGISKPLADCPLQRMKDTKCRESKALQLGDRWLEITTDPVLDDDQRIVTAVHIITDITERKRVDLELQQSREQYESLYGLIRLMCDNVPDMIWAKDLSNRYIFANRTICENLLNARDTGEPIGKSDMYFAERERGTHPDNPDWHTFGEICTESDTVVLSSKKAGRFDEYGNIKGQFLYLDVYKAPFYNEQGNMIGTVGCGRDVTQEKKAEQERREAEEKYHAIFENAVEGIFQTTVDGRILSANSALASLFGFDSPEDLMTAVTDIGSQLYVNHEDRERLLRLINENGEVKGFEFRAHRKDKSICWISINIRLVRNGIGESMHYEGFAMDISCRKEAEEALKESENKYRLLADNVNDVIFVLDLNLNYTYVSPSVKFLRGYEPAEVLIQPFHVTLTPSSWFLAMKTLSEVLVLEESEDTEIPMFRTLQLEMNRKDGTTVWTEVTFSLVRDEDRRPLNILCVTRDIAKRKQMEEALEEERRRLQQALAEVRTLRGIVPICSSCKKIRDDNGFWNQVEKYVSDHTEAKFSSGICPDCTKVLYPELYK